MPTFTNPALQAGADWKVSASYFTHFVGLPSELTVTGLDANAGLSIADAAGGGYGRLTTGDADPGNNDGVFLATQGEIFKFDTTHAFSLRSQLKWTPTAAAADNVLALGLMNAPTENTFLADNGAGPPADYWGACIYKVDGGNTWLCEVSYGATQQTLDTEIVVDGSETTFEIEYQPTLGANGQVTFRINGELVRRPGSFFREYFAPQFELTNATEMKGLIGVKKGDAAATPVAIDVNAFGFSIALNS
ncbi:hypothetical protein DTL42_18340 [Bremerella cremea]|uniref:Uncharacterized protein n=1 Tax=Bremerella cremea TaxID=1031537 RepID=A0A368KPW1_9BACT|nr:hypothetical protein [Bremerella cremea]RCS43946.1 hypothetical protein DTL42_18340 [Bremerella cremea]